MNRLVLSRETLRTLQSGTLRHIQAGADVRSGGCPESMLITCYTCALEGCVLDETGYTGNCYTAAWTCNGSAPGTR